MAGKPTVYKLVVLGDAGVGKTALTIQLLRNHFVQNYDPTIEDAYRKQVRIDQQTCMLEVLDTSGNEEYAILRGQWITPADVFILVYSVTSRHSFTTIQDLHAQIQSLKDSGSIPQPTGSGSLPPTMNPHSVGPVPVMLVGNKTDQQHKREVSSQEGYALAKRLRCEFVETSGKTSSNVEKAFYDIVRLLRNQRQCGPSKQLDQKGTAMGKPGFQTDQDALRMNKRKARRFCASPDLLSWFFSTCVAIVLRRHS